MPVVNAGDVLVKVMAAAVNPLDWRLMRADPFLVRMHAGLFRPKYNCLGADFSGVVESVGEGVTRLKAGDAVFGLMAPEFVGCFAEYVAIPESGIVRKPEMLSHAQASTLGIAALTAYEGIHDYYSIQTGERVLINGASGGIGTFAVQMAKAQGAQVTAVCSGRNAALVRGIGADEVIDYQSTELLRVDARFDLIFDTIGNHPPKKLKPLLGKEGRLVLASAANGLSFIKAMLLARDKHEPIDMIIDLKKGQARLERVLKLVEAGAVTPVIDREYAFDEVVEAIDYAATKRARGKVVVNIGGAVAGK